MRNSIILGVVIAIVASNVAAQNCKIPRSSPVLKQCDFPYKDFKLGSSTTICKSGCAMCSVASGLAGLGKTIGGKSINCETFNQYLQDNHGYSGNAIIWATANRLGVTYEGQITSISAIKTAVCDNKLVVLNVKAGGHWVLATGVNGNTFFVNDPGYQGNTYNGDEVVRASVYRV